MKILSVVGLSLLLGLSAGWYLGLRCSRSASDRTSRFQAIETYIADTVPFLRKNGAEHIDMQPLPYDGGGAVLVRGSVRTGDEFYILHTILENRLTNPDLPARLVWQVTLADREQTPNQGAAANGLSAVRSSVAGNRGRTERSTATPKAVAELGR